MNNSHLLYKTRCPKCAENGRDRSKDNLGVYSDGHSYCFSCGYSSGSTVHGRINSTTKQIKQIPPFPEDISNTLGENAKRWLLRYFPTKENFPRCFWSEQEKKLYFMLEGDAYQYRYFGDNKDHPKWVGYGITDNLIHIVNPSYNYVSLGPIVLVEDIISGSKVGHITPTLTLFGSNISLKRLATLKLLGYNEVIIWLDWDKREYAIKAAQLAQSIGLEAQVIHTKLDPKDYTFEEISELLIPHQTALQV